ncbi:hypothetical protein M9458_048973, partial [Cirrhinus mrigala]
IQSKKAKEELLAKRVELKSDRKARAMASRTKDNFRGYNGIPVIDQPKKRRSKGESSEEQQTSNTYYDDDDDDDDGDNYEYEGTDSESEEPSIPVKPQSRPESSNRVDSKPKKPSAPARPPTSSMNFADLLKLAEKKQFEPVEMKVVKKTEERLRTAEEIRELEMERRVKNQDRGREVKPDKNSGHKDSRSQSSSNSQKKNVERDGKIGKRPSGEKFQSSSTSKKPKLQPSSERTPSSAKLHGDRNSGSSGALNGKAAMKNGAPVQSKQAPSRPTQGQRPTASSDLTPKKGNTSIPQGKSSISGIRAGVAPGAARPSQGPHKNSGQVRPSNSERGGQPQKPAKPGHLSRPGSNGLVRPSSGDPLKQPRPGGSLQGQQIPGRSKASINAPSRMGGGVSGRPVNGMGSGPGRPQDLGWFRDLEWFQDLGWFQDLRDLKALKAPGQVLVRPPGKGYEKNLFMA